MRSKLLRITLGCAIGCVILYFVLRQANWQEIFAAWKQAKPAWIIAGASCIFLELVLKGIRWMRILEGRWHRPKTYIQATFIGIGASTFLPLRAGEFMKVFFVIKKTGRTLAKTALSVVVERLFDVAMLGILLLLGFALHHELMLRWLKTFSIGNTSFMKIATVLILLLLSLVPVIALILWKTKLRLSIDKIRDKLHLVPSRLIHAAILSIAIWTLDTLFYWFMSRGFSQNMRLNWGQTIFLFSIVSMAFVSSISPGALGIFEFLGIWVLQQFSKPKEEALAFLLASHGTMFIVLAICVLIVAAQETWPPHHPGRQNVPSK